MDQQTILHKLRNVAGALSPNRDKAAVKNGDLLDLYNILESYYLNTGLYERLAVILGNQLQPEALTALRTPARRVVEFYAGTIWPGSLPKALPIVTENDRIIEPIEKVWQWSNWATKKQLAIRRLAMFGDLILKVSRRDQMVPEGEASQVEAVPSSVFIEVINPKHVPEGGLVLDERGNVIYIRVDVPKIEVTAAGQPQKYTHTEIWDRSGFRRYKHTKGFNAPIDQLGTAEEEEGLAAFGIDFVPFVYAAFTPIDELARGIGAYTLALEKINEVNRMATRLHDLLFRYNKAVWALRSNMVDAAGRPIVVDIEGDVSGDAGITLADDDLLKLPGNADLTPLVPSLAYGDYLAAIAAQAQELENDLPELAYSRLREKGELSGRAITLLLGDAIARAIEARGAAETALIKAHKMALTIGRLAGIFGDIGTYEAGDFDHSFIERPIIRSTEQDKAEIAKAYREVGLAVATALARAGWSQEDIKDALEALAEERDADQQALAAATLEAARRLDSGAASNGMEQPEPPAPTQAPAPEPTPA